MNYPENQPNMRDKLPYPPYSLHLTYSLKCLQVREIAEKKHPIVQYRRDN